MADIYSNAHFVLCTSLAEGDSEGFLRPLSVRGSRLLLSLIWKPGYQTRGDSHLSAPMDTRAWCFQESLLARRIVAYDESGLRYHCGVYAEGLHDSYGFLQDGKWAAFARHRMPNLLIGDHPLTPEDWKIIVEEYTSRRLTVPSDRLPALSGIASTLNRKREQKYLGGLWAHHLPKNLLWSVVSSGASRNISLQHSPSFALSSVNEKIDVNPAGNSYRLPNFPSMVKTLRADCFVKGPDPYGHVSWGVLRLLGSLYTAELFKIPREERWVVSKVHDTRPNGPIHIGREHDESHQIVSDAQLVTRSSTNKQTGQTCLCRTYASEDLGTGETTAWAKLLLVAEEIQEYHSEKKKKAFFFLVLGPTHPPEGCPDNSLKYQRLGSWTLYNHWDDKSPYKFQRNDQEVTIV
ncbi:hypothetical protein LTS10_001265 [Elasticomyces elasticus]|nr:hypothetical protein LTS10_001265 [Elasticomyces elasticus]